VSHPDWSARAGWVYLVGAGPGDPGLLTLRAAELLRTADVIAHDELVPEALLERAAPGAERLAVGRRCHGRTRDPLKLHPAVLERARAGKSVVRLKAGDPFVFGRGGEEGEELAAAGIPFDVVPGVSAALGAAAAARIPLTHRELSSDVTFATGHDLTRTGGPSRSDWAKLAGSGTLVLYMASRSLAGNLARLVERGRPAETPAAWIAAATRPEQEVVIGTLADLAARVGERSGDAPALVVVGEVVAVRERLLGLAVTGARP
jgi:uroporphyrin-III C-methyltransferase